MVMGNCVIVRDLATTRTLAMRRLEVNHWNIRLRLEFLSDGSILFTTSFLRREPPRFESSVVRWDWTTNRLTADRVFPTPRTNPFGVAASRDGRRIALSEEGFVTVWDGTLAREIGRIQIPPSADHVPLMALSADGTRMALTTTDEPSITVWDTATSQLLLTLTDDDVHRFLVFTLGGQLVAVNASGGLTIWETQRPKCPQCPKTPVPVK
jgi:WD40 repeat protein